MGEDHGGLHIAVAEKLLNSSAAWRQFKLRGRDNVSAVFGLHVIAYNLIRLSNILMPAMVVA